MYLSNFGSTLLTAAMAISFVEASPFELDPRSFSSLSARELTGTSCAPFLYGAKYTEYQKVCISATGSALTITYPNLPSAGNYSDIHVIVQTTPIQEPVQGKWPYGSSAGKTGCQIAGGSATCTIPMQTGWKVCNSQLFIGVHASFSLDGLSGETGWREGTCITDRSNCPRYSTFTTECKCPVVTTYEPYTTSVCFVLLLV